MSQGSLNPKIRFLGQNVCHVVPSQTDRQTDGYTERHTYRLTIMDILSGFHEFLLQPIIKDPSNIRLRWVFCVIKSF